MTTFVPVEGAFDIPLPFHADADDDSDSLADLWLDLGCGD